MKKLALLFALTFCALQARAQSCYGWMDCSCQPCHYAAKGCNGNADCVDCSWACQVGVKALPTHATLPKKPDSLGDITAIGQAWKAAVIHTPMFRDPFTRGGFVPKGHPVIPASFWTKVRTEAANPAKCKAPVGVQILASSMLRK